MGGYLPDLKKRWLNFATYRKWMEEDCFPFPGKFENLLMNYCWTWEVDPKFLRLPDRQTVWHYRCVHYQLFAVFLKKIEGKRIKVRVRNQKCVMHIFWLKNKVDKNY